MIDVIVDVFVEYGLCANLTAGKTEVSMQLIGRYSRTIKSNMPVDAVTKNRLLVTPLNRSVQIVDVYKHLGTMRHVTGDMLHDAKYKVSRSNEAYFPLSQRIFGNQDVYRKTRVSLANSLCFSRFRFGLDTWVRVTKPAVAKVHSARMRVLRKICGAERYDENSVSDAVVLSQVDLLHTDVWMLGLRLRSLHWQLAGDLPLAFTALRKQYDTPAAKQVADDLVWAWEASPLLHHMPDPRLEYKAWVALIIDKEAWHTALLGIQANASRHKTSPPAFVKQGEPVPEDHFACDQCPVSARRLFASSQALAVHKSKSHSIICPERLVVEDNLVGVGFTCKHCKTEFKSTVKAIAHIRDGQIWSTKCAYLYNLRRLR